MLHRTNTLTNDVTYTTTYPVGPQGGALSFGGHTLVIPKLTVKHWTHFSATLRAGDEIRIDLRAWDMFGAVTNFRRPVELTIDLSDASAEDLDGVSVFYLDLTGATERMPSVLNLENRTVTGYLDHFSNVPGSEATSNGTYITSDTYHGKYGLSMKVKGLDWTNNNAENRAIVIHNAWYAEPDVIAQHGKLGRSQGCFAFSRASQWQVMSRLGDGRMIYADKLA